MNLHKEVVRFNILQEEKNLKFIEKEIAFCNSKYDEAVQITRDLNALSEKEEYMESRIANNRIQVEEIQLSRLEELNEKFAGLLSSDVELKKRHVKNLKKSATEMARHISLKRKNADLSRNISFKLVTQRQKVESSLKAYNEFYLRTRLNLPLVPIEQMDAYFQSLRTSIENSNKELSFLHELENDYLKAQKAQIALYDADHGDIEDRELLPGEFLSKKALQIYSRLSFHVMSACKSLKCTGTVEMQASLESNYSHYKSLLQESSKQDRKDLAVFRLYLVKENMQLLKERKEFVLLMKQTEAFERFLQEFQATFKQSKLENCSDPIKLDDKLAQATVQMIELRTNLEYFKRTNQQVRLKEVLMKISELEQYLNILSAQRNSKKPIETVIIKKYEPPTARAPPMPTIPNPSKHEKPVESEKFMKHNPETNAQLVEKLLAKYNI